LKVDDQTRPPKSSTPPSRIYEEGVEVLEPVRRFEIIDQTIPSTIARAPARAVHSSDVRYPFATSMPPRAVNTWRIMPAI
jgi:hypothetical protein